MSGKAGIPVILRGDTARGVEIALAEGYDYGGSALVVDFCGVRREFDGLAAGCALELAFSAEETAAFPLGTSRVRLALRNAAGEVRSLPWAKIKVTDAPGEVYAARIPADPGALDVEDLKPGDGQGAVKARVNAILAFLRKGAGALCLAASLAAPVAASAAEPLLALLDDVPGDAPVLTNAVEYIDARTAAATNGLLRAEADPAFSEWTNGTEVVLGRGARTWIESGVAVGHDAKADYNDAVAIGHNPWAGGPWSVAIGDEALVVHQRAVAIGHGARSHGDDTFSVHADGPEKFYLGERSLQSFLDDYAKPSVTNGLATKAEVDATISPTDPTFSNAVLAVGLNIDTNSVAVLNEIASTFGGFPIEGTATTVGGILAALAAAIAWLKKNKVGSFESVGGASATVENGVAKLDDFFTESNSLLTSRVNNLIDEKVGDVNAVLAAALDGSEVA